MNTNMCFLMLVLSATITFASEEPLPVAAKADQLLGRSDFAHLNRTHTIELHALSIPAKEGFGQRFRFQLLPGGSPDANGERTERRILIDLPDIPTHDVLGAPPTARGGSLIMDWAARKCFVVVGKAIGPGLILRIYEVSIQQNDEGELTWVVSSEPTAETSMKLRDNDNDSPLRIRADRQANVILVRASRTRNINAETEVRFDRVEKRFVKSSE